MDPRGLVELYLAKENVRQVIFFTEDPNTKEEGAIEASRLVSFKELAWHPTVKQIECNGEKWTVSHIPTGLAIAFFNNRKEAKKFVSMARKFEWSFNLEDWNGYSKGERQRLLKWVSKVKNIAQKGMGNGKKKAGSTN